MKSVSPLVRRISGVALFSILVLLVITLSYPVLAQAVDVPPTIDNQDLFGHRSILPRVEGSTGALTESVKLEVPPGRNGLTPELSLEYNSQNLSDSIVGYGWSLSIPYIERLNKTGSEKLYTDGYFISSSGGELATTTTANEYRHRIEDGRFIKYTFSNNIWTAYDKDGTRYLFGTTTQAQQAATTSPGNVYKWMLEEVRDANDNFIRYEYNKDFNQIYPYKIFYTGSGSSDGPFTIQFSTSTRPDTPISFKTGFQINTRYRVSEVKAFVDSSWIRKYTLSYTNGVNGARSLLSSVQQTGRDENSTELSLPSTTFGYSSSTPAYTTDNNIPQISSASYVSIDADGNGLTDRVIFKEGGANPVGTVNDNAYPTFSTGSIDPAPDYWANTASQPVDRGVRFFDVNGDGRADVVKSVKFADGSYTRAYYQRDFNEYSWASTTIATGTIPAFSYENNSSEKYSTGLLGNINGDGLIDYVISMAESVGGGVIAEDNGTYLHVGTSSGWSLATSTFSPLSTMPTSATEGAIATLVDINADGLDDWMSSGSGSITFRLNTGIGWESSHVNDWYIATSSRHANGWDRGIRFIDVNGDELLDYVRAYHMPSYSSGSAAANEIGTYNYVYLNTGSGFATSSLTLPTYIFLGVLDAGAWNGTIEYNEPIDWNGDGILDQYNKVSTSTKPDVLVQTTYPTGGTTEVKHKYTTQITADNPDLELPVLVVTEKTTRDHVADPQATSYLYEGGKTYLSGDIRDRRFAGFKAVTKIESGLGIMKTYFNQGDGVDTATGEQTDDLAQIGRPYRELVTTLATSTMKDTYFKWTSVDQGVTGRKYAYLEKEMSMHYDGDSDHRDVAIEYTYTTTTGDLTQVVRKGEVTGSTNGTYTDVPGDTTTKDITYAGNTAINLRVPTQETITNNGGIQVKLSNFYYDNAAHGTVTTGNRTKDENWISGSTYASSTKAYNSYGLVTSETDPRSKTTSHQYEGRNLYIATSTNSLSHVTGFSYDYATGKTKLKIDPNNRTWQWVYDPVGRLTERKGPDPSSGSLVTMASTIYTDNMFPRKQQETHYLGSATSTDIYTYLDGLGRPIQKRMESSTSYAVKDKMYGNHGLLQKESIPYFSSGTAYTAATTSATALTTYAYDALRRIATTTNALGSETHAFDQWKETITDRRGKPKDLISDAHGNLANVIEYLNGAPATTTYTYDALGNLTKIADALGNIRNFFYDGLSRATSTEDLHASGDGTFGTWTHTYDLASNVTQTVDPKSQTVNKTYDAINRILTEDYTGSGGTEVTYEYDTCSEGTGRLCIATTTDAVTTYAYNPLGLPSSETKKIDNINYATSYTYDRLGNTATIAYPNSSTVHYDHDSAGLLDGIYQKESGGSYVAVVDNIDYGPTGAITVKDFENGVSSTYTYDSEELYRLTNILTQAGGVGGAGFDLSSLDISEDLIAQLRRADENQLAQDSPREEAVILGDISTTTRDSNETTIEALPIADETATTSNEAPHDVQVTVEVLGLATTTDNRPPDLLPSIPEETAVALASMLPQATSTADVATSTLRAPMSALLEGKSAAEKATIKGQEIAKIGATPRMKRGAVDIQITSINPIEGGIEVFARAWNENGKIGFGRDGTVEIERFHIVNPPILVDDPKGDIIRTWKDVDGAVHERRLREDSQEALLDSLAHTISVKQQKFSAENIIRGKVGNTTSTFYPTSGASSPVDGFAYRGGGVSESFSTIRAGNGTTGRSEDGSPTYCFSIRGAATSNEYDLLVRSFFLFDTSSINDSDTIDSATMSLVFTNKEETITSQSAALVGSTPASESDIVASDYQGTVNNTTRYGTDKTIASLNVGGSTYTDWTMNATGISNISKTGRTKLGLRVSADADNSAPTWASDSNGAFTFCHHAEASGTTKDPKLVVEHSAGGGGGGGSELQNLTYTYDATGNITRIVDASETATQKTTDYSYDDLSRLATASTTNATTSPDYVYSYVYNLLGNLASSPLGTYSYGGSGGSNYANPHAVTALVSTTGATSSIQYDNSTASGAGTSTLTFSHTIYDNTDGLLVVSVYASPPTGSCTPDPITGVTYNGTSLTDLGYYVGNNTTVGGSIKSYYLLAPPEGTYDVVVTASANCIGKAVAASYAGVKQSGMPDASGSGNPLQDSGTVDELNRTVVTNTQNAWLWMCGVPSAGGSATALSGTTMRQQPGGIYCADAGPKATVGSNGIGWSKANTNWVANFFSFAPVSTGTNATTTYAYDENGNLTSASPWSYSWTYNNLLSQAATGTATSTYAYDHAGQRVKQVAAGVTTHYPSKLYAISGATTTAYIWAGNDLVATIVADGLSTTTSYIHGDHLGSTNVVTDESGNVVQTLDYYPYGGQRINEGTETTDRQFIGERYDEESDLNYFNARYADTGRGQFLSQDPVFLAVGNPGQVEQHAGVKQKALLSDPQLMNSYAYARGNPIRYKDPEGKIAPLAAWGIFWAWSMLNYTAVQYNIESYEAETMRLNPEIYTPEQAAAAQRAADTRIGVSGANLAISRLNQPLGVAVDVVGVMDDARDEYYERHPEAQTRVQELRASLSQQESPISHYFGPNSGFQSFLAPQSMSGLFPSTQSYNPSNQYNYNTQSSSGGGGGGSLSSLLGQLASKLTQLRNALSGNSN